MFKRVKTCENGSDFSEKKAYVQTRKRLQVEVMKELHEAPVRQSNLQSSEAEKHPKRNPQKNGKKHEAQTAQEFLLVSRILGEESEVCVWRSAKKLLEKRCHLFRLKALRQMLRTEAVKINVCSQVELRETVEAKAEPRVVMAKGKRRHSW